MPSEMQHQVMGYDRTATMFSPDGHLLQVEYAEKTVRLGPASIGMICKDGILIVADKRVRDKLIEAESTHKIFEIDIHIILTAAGMLSDARILVDQAQVLAQQNRVTYDSPIEPISVIRMLSDRKQAFTQYGGARPYGVSLMLGGVNKGKSHLYTSDVTGNFLAYRANAIGENDEKIKEMLRKDFKEGISTEEGIRFCLRIFKEIMGKNFDLDRFEIGRVNSSTELMETFHGEALKKYSK